MSDGQNDNKTNSRYRRREEKDIGQLIKEELRKDQRIIAKCPHCDTEYIVTPMNAPKVYREM